MTLFNTKRQSCVFISCSFNGITKLDAKTGVKKQKLLNIGETQVVLRKNDLLGNEKKIGIAAKTFTKPDEVIFFAI